MSMALVTNTNIDATMAFEPSDFRGAIELAKTLVASRLLPKSVQTPEAAFTIIMTGRELGLTAMQSLRSIHVIEGKPTLSADLMLALVKKSADCEYFRLVESTDAVATYETKRRGEPCPTRMSFTIADAQRAQVTGKDNWRKYPAAMLRARAITALARAVYPDTAMGLYDPDELTQAPPQTVASEVIRAVPEPAAEDDGGEAFDAFCKRLAEAKTRSDVDAIGQDFAKVAESLPPAVVASFRRVFASKRAATPSDVEATQAAAPTRTESLRDRLRQRQAVPVGVVDDPYAHGDDEREAIADGEVE